MDECLTCKSNQGIKRISPGEQIYSGQFWNVEHAYPSGLLGWLVIVLKRHTDELHGLLLEEWQELSEINYRVINLLHKVLETKKEYICCFAEGEGFKHIHFHIIPKSNKFDANLGGTKSFLYLKKGVKEPIKKEEVIKFCSLLKEEIK